MTYQNTLYSVRRREVAPVEKLKKKKKPKLIYMKTQTKNTLIFFKEYKSTFDFME